MKLEGSLDAFSLPDIFQLLSYTKKSGGLRLSHGGADGVVYFADGFVTGASADGVRQALARRLIGSGAVDDDALTAGGRPTADDAGAASGPLLVEAAGAVEPSSCARRPPSRRWTPCSTCSAGRPATSRSTSTSRTPTTSGIRLAPDVVVAEAAQRQAAWDAVASVIPGPDTVLAMPVVARSRAGS